MSNSCVSLSHSQSISSPGPEEGIQNDGDYLYRDEARPASLLAGFSSLYRNKQFVDVTLLVDNHEFPCHKNMLAASSPYFHVMFSTQLAEGNQVRISLSHLDPSTFDMVLQYIYTGQVYLTEEMVQNLLSAANLFQLLPLRDGCAEFMKSHITVTNCIGVYFFAKAHECNELAVKAKEIINNKFPEVCQQQEFLLLPVDKLVEIISDDSLNVSLEEIVYEACMTWIQEDEAEREQHLLQVLDCVRFANISSYYFCDRIDTNPLMRKKPDLELRLTEVRCYHMLKNRQQEMDLKLMPRAGMSYERGIMIISNPYTENILKKYNTMEMLLPNTGEVITICKLPLSLYTPGVAVTGDNQIYLAGGAIRKINSSRGSVTTEGVSNAVHVFNQMEAVWMAKCPMNMARSQFSLVVVDSYLYAIGGHDGSEILNTVEQYDPTQNQWTLVASLPDGVRFATSVSYKGQLYVFGGETKNDFTHRSFRYNPSTDRWFELPTMQKPRVLAASVVFKDKIYVIGGNTSRSDKWKKEYLPENCVASVEIFDPETENWSEGPPLANALCGAGVVKYGDTILVVGGEDDKSWMAGICWLKQDGAREAWVWWEGQELPTVMSNFGCVVANVPHQLIKDKL